MSRWTPEKALAHAPDGQVARAARGLARRDLWPLLGRTDRGLWGECRGSGKKPYRVRVDLEGLAFKCSCPSRKHPCKHSLCLLLIHAGEPTAVPAGKPPPWLTEWLDERDQRAARGAVTSPDDDDAPRDVAAAARRVAAREKKILAGLEDLSLWLADLVREGLAAARTRAPTTWDHTASRLVDAQAPGLAGLVRRLGAAVVSCPDWQLRALSILGRLHLAVEGYRRLATLPEETRADLRAVVGWTVGPDDLRDATTVSDRWAVLGRHEETLDRLLVRRTWLLGQESRRRALFLQFAHLSQDPPESPAVGACIDTDLVFHPSGAPLRANVFDPTREGDRWDPTPLAGTVRSECRAHREALARQPWLETWPLLLRDVVPVPPDGDTATWMLRDAEGATLPISPACDHGWHLLGLGGGRPLVLFGEWDRESFRPLTVLTRDGPFVLANLVLASPDGVPVLEAR